MTEITVLTPTGSLGYGFDSDAFTRAMGMGPQVIAVDSGSTDPGPHYLGSGEPLVPRLSIKKELTTMLVAGCGAGIPVVVGSAGGGGTNRHVDWMAVAAACLPEAPTNRRPGTRSNGPTWSMFVMHARYDSIVGKSNSFLASFTTSWPSM